LVGIKKQINAEDWAEKQSKTAAGKLARFTINDSLFTTATTTITMQDGTVLTVYGKYSVVKIGGIIEQPFMEVPTEFKGDRFFCIEGECRIQRNEM
jgi:hypothetical protein